MTGTTDEAVVNLALRALTNHEHIREVEDAEIADRPGLYAVHADTGTWDQLGLAGRPDHRPLYVGKSESSLARRDLRTHFSTGKTGSSTLRRSLAGLLATTLDLQARPRNLNKPGHLANFALEPAGDDRLTQWMRVHLSIATFETPSSAVIGSIEAEVIRVLCPPLNLTNCSTLWRGQVADARKRLADQARRWRADNTAAGSEAK